MKNKISILVLLFVIVIPQVVSASWWNPLSWFKSEDDFNKIENQATTTEEKNINQIEPTVETKTEQKTTIQEKIIEKTITVDNPELQKKINALLQENIALQSKVASLTVSLNTCKATNTDKSETSSSGYSDFNFTYFSTTNQITFPFSTSRDIVIKKAVFHIKETDTRETRKAGSVQRLELITSTGAKPIYYNLENNIGSTFTFLGTGIPLKGKETMVVNVSIDGKENETFYMVPDFSEWEVWDNTTNKPVIIN